MDKKYKRVILKISGEFLASFTDSEILNPKKLQTIANIIKKLRKNKIEVGVVVGAGNIFRGAKLSDKLGIDQKDGDYMGMLGTIINCKALEDVLKKNGIKTYFASALGVEKVCKPYNLNEVRRKIKNHVVLFAGGTGNPFCTTDTCASLRALEVKADAILIGKNGVDGVYDKDPRKYKSARFIKELSYKDIIKNNLQVIDKSAAQMLIGSNVVVRIFGIKNLDNFLKVVDDEKIGTIIKEK